MKLRDGRSLHKNVFKNVRNLMREGYSESEASVLALDHLAKCREKAPKPYAGPNQSRPKPFDPLKPQKVALQKKSRSKSRSAFARS